MTPEEKKADDAAKDELDQLKKKDGAALEKGKKEKSMTDADKKEKDRKDVENNGPPVKPIKKAGNDEFIVAGLPSN